MRNGIDTMSERGTAADLKPLPKPTQPVSTPKKKKVPKERKPTSRTLQTQQKLVSILQKRINTVETARMILDGKRAGEIIPHESISDIPNRRLVMRFLRRGYVQSIPSRRGLRVARDIKPGEIKLPLEDEIAELIAGRKVGDRIPMPRKWSKRYRQYVMIVMQYHEECTLVFAGNRWVIEVVKKATA
jgi:hypothetical protein